MSIQQRAAQLRTAERIRLRAEGLLNQAGKLLDLAHSLEHEANEQHVYIIPVNPADETNCEACQ